MAGIVCVLIELFLPMRSHGFRLAGICVVCVALHSFFTSSSCNRRGKGGGAQVPYSILANLKDLIKLFKMSILCGLREYSVWACECWLHILFLDQETEGGG